MYRTTTYERMVLVKKKELIFAALFFILPIFMFADGEMKGIASWYGPKFHGKLTANGERFNTYSLTAAHKTLPLNSVVKVTSLVNGKEVIVRINDRGPYAKGRVVDLSKAAAVRLDMLKAGTMPVKLEVLRLGDNKYQRYSPTRYDIQVASFKDMKKAQTLCGKLAKENVKAVISQKKVSGTIVYRVEIRDLTYGMLHAQKIALHSAGIHDYLIKKS